MPKSRHRCVTSLSVSCLERAGVEEEIDPLARGELPGLVLLLPAGGAAAELRAPFEVVEVIG
jgi:hypothetical protein